MSIVTTLPLPALVTAVCAAVALTGCGVSVDLGGDVTERTESEVIDAAGIERLRVETGNGRITVTAGDTDEIDVTARLRETDEGDADWNVRDDGGTLVLEGRCDEGWFDECSVGFDVVVPADLGVDVETDNGRIDLDGLAGTVAAETDNGSIAATALQAPTVRADSDNGRIELRFSETPDDVTATSDNGSIAVRFPDDGGSHDVTTKTDNGSVTVDVRTDPTSDRSIAVETDNGSIEVAYLAR